MKRIKILLICCYIVNWQYCIAQSSPKNNISTNYIDSIKNASQIEDLLIKTGGKKYENYTINTDLSFPDSACKKLCDSLKIKAWQIADLNNDGNSDILFSAKNGADYFDLCILTKDKNNYGIVSLTRDAGSYSKGSCAVVKVSNLKTVIDYYFYKSNYDPHNIYAKPVLQKIQLVYDFGDFIEVNHSAPQHTIEKIIFDQKSAGFNSPAYNITIKNDKSAIWIWDSKYYNVIKGKEVKGNYETILKNYSYDYLVRLLNYIDFKNLDNNYAVPWTDDQSCVLTIIYDNGKVKRITDYGQVGTFGLQRTYQILLGLWQTQDWHKRY